MRDQNLLNHARNGKWRDQNLVNNAAFHKQNRLIGGSKESKPRIYTGTAHFFMVKMFLNWNLFAKLPVDFQNFVPGFSSFFEGKIETLAS